MMRVCYIALVTSLFCWMPASNIVAQSMEDQGRFLHWAYQDAWWVLKETQPRHLVYGAVTMVGLGLLATQDEVLFVRVQPTDALRWTEQLGRKPIFPVAGGLFLFTLTTKNPKLQDAAFTSFESIVYAGSATIILKTLLGRARPEDEEGAFSFHSFATESTSWPSGHTAIAFALVTPWVMYYPNALTYGLLVLSTGTAISRVMRGRHWTTDVVAGGIVGTVTGYILSKKHLRGAESSVSIAPIIGQSVGIRAWMSF